MSEQSKYNQKRHSRPFDLMPNKIWQMNLTSYEFIVFAWIWHCCFNGEGECLDRHEAICNHLNISLKQFYRSLKVLEQKNMIVRETKKGISSSISIVDQEVWVTQLESGNSPQQYLTNFSTISSPFATLAFDLFDPKLDLMASDYRVYAQIYKRGHDSEQGCTQRLENLCKEAGVSKRQFINSANKLVALGVLIKSKGKKNTTHYQVVVNPSDWKPQHSVNDKKAPETSVCLGINNEVQLGLITT